MLERISITSILICLMLSLGGQAWASPKGDATDLVKQNYAEIKRLVGASKDRDELSGKITVAMDSLISWDSFSQKTLSTTTWSSLDKKQKTLFIGAYRKLIVRRYSKRFKPGASFSVEFRNGPDDDENKPIIRTTVHSKDGQKNLGVDVDYEFWPAPKGHRVADIVTDGVSRARSYRPKFKSILKKRGFEALIKAIERNAKRR